VVTVDGAAGSADWSDPAAGVDAAVRAGARTLVFDVSRTDRLSSPTVTALLRAQHHCRARGGAVVLLAPSRRLCRMLRDTGLARFFELASSASRDGSAVR
jgi:anti-anti-sigma factor